MEFRVWLMSLEFRVWLIWKGTVRAPVRYRYMSCFEILRLLVAMLIYSSLLSICYRHRYDHDSNIILTILTGMTEHGCHQHGLHRLQSIIASIFRQASFHHQIFFLLTPSQGKKEAVKLVLLVSEPFSRTWICHEILFGVPGQS